jgi:CheY-like chemotaxis protein
MELGTKPRVLLADDHVHLRIALTRLLEPECEMVARATTVAELVAEAQTWRPDVVVVDLMLPESNGLDACRQLKTALPAIRTVMVRRTEIGMQSIRERARMMSGTVLFQSRPAVEGTRIAVVIPLENRPTD